MNAKDFIKKYGLNVNGSLDLESRHKAFIEKYKIGEIIDGCLVIGKNNGGWVELNGLTSLDVNKDCFKNWGIVRLKDKKIPAAKTMQNNSNDKFICCDGIFTEVLKKGQFFWKLKKQGGKRDVCFLVTDGNGLYAHGNTIKEAKADLMYKISSDKSKENYKNLTIDSILSLENAIKCYRVITGACYFGVKDFVEKNNLHKTKEISIKEIIKLTDNAYGNKVFKSFFAQ